MVWIIITQSFQIQSSNKLPLLWSTLLFSTELKSIVIQEVFVVSAQGKAGFTWANPSNRMFTIWRDTDPMMHPQQNALARKYRMTIHYIPSKGLLCRQGWPPCWASDSTYLTLFWTPGKLHLFGHSFQLLHSDISQFLEQGISHGLRRMGNRLPSVLQLMGSTIFPSERTQSTRRIFCPMPHTASSKQKKKEQITVACKVVTKF